MDRIWTDFTTPTSGAARSKAVAFPLLSAFPIDSLWDRTWTSCRSGPPVYKCFHASLFLCRLHCCSLRLAIHKTSGWIQAKLLNAYEMRHRGELEWVLSIQIMRDRGARRLWLCQDSYLDILTSKFNILLWSIPSLEGCNDHYHLNSVLVTAMEHPPEA